MEFNYHSAQTRGGPDDGKNIVVIPNSLHSQSSRSRSPGNQAEVELLKLYDSLVNLNQAGSLRDTSNLKVQSSLA